MFSKIIHFIKYNNATIIILAVILILGGGALAAGPEAIGEKQAQIQGIDNAILIQADLTGFNMDFKIEKIEQDEKYYYAAYSYLDLAVINRAWQYGLNQKTVKISKKIKSDLGEYLTKYLAKHHQARLRELKLAQAQALAQGEQKRMEVIEYSGLIGRTLDIAAKVFPGYEPVKKKELASPEFNLPNLPNPPLSSGENAGGADKLTKIYNDYVAGHPEIFTELEAPAEAEAKAAAAAEEAPAESVEPKAEIPAIFEPESVEIIELPVEAIIPAEPAPAAESATPAEAPAENAAPAPAPETPAESAPAE